MEIEQLNAETLPGFYHQLAVAGNRTNLQETLRNSTVGCAMARPPTSNRFATGANQTFRRARGLAFCTFTMAKHKARQKGAFLYMALAVMVAVAATIVLKRPPS